MVTPKRAWSLSVPSSLWNEPTALRLIVMGALLFSAFSLHNRASELEQRERSLQDRIGAFSRQTQSLAARPADLRAVTVSLDEPSEVATEGLTRNETNLVDEVVTQAHYQEVSPPMVIQTSKQ